MSAPDNVVASYLSLTGLKPFKNGGAFLSYLHKTYGAAAMSLEIAINKMAGGSFSSDFYSIKNKSLNLSLDVSSAFNYALYKEFLTWFLNEKFKAPRRLLDIGCDNGILTCFYAKVFPEAEIVGIDKSPEAIDRARELAQKLSLANVSFEVADINGLAAKLTGSKFDLITAVAVFHEVDPGLKTRERSWSVYQEDLSARYPEIIKVLRNINGLLESAEGCLISVDRWAEASNIIRWLRLLGDSGLAVRWEHSDALRFRNLDNQPEKLLVSVAKPGTGRAPATEDDILAFLVCFETGQDKVFTTLEGSPAEALFKSLQPGTRLIGREITYRDGRGVMRSEIRQSDALVFQYDSSDLGYRRLVYAPKLVAGELVQFLKSEAETLKKEADIVFY